VPSRICAPAGRLTGAARQRDRRRRGEPDVQPAERDLDSGRAGRVADEPVRESEGGRVEGARSRDAERRVAGAAQILDGGKRAGMDDLDHVGTKRTRVPGANSAGGVRCRSHSGASVVPSSRQPPGEGRG
jgi:hypothetical protein